MDEIDKVKEEVDEARRYKIKNDWYQLDEWIIIKID
jgi:hypothetical protein